MNKLCIAKSATPALLLVTLSWVAVGELLPFLLPNATFHVFALPAGWLANLWLGLPGSLSEEALILHHRAGEVQVTLACCGAGFWGMTAGLMTWCRAVYPRGRGLLATAAIAVIAYGLTVPVNAVRIVSGVVVAEWATGRVPSSFLPSLHWLTGIVTFLPALIGLHLLFITRPWRNSHD